MAQLMEILAILAQHPQLRIYREIMNALYRLRQLHPEINSEYITWKPAVQQIIVARAENGIRQHDVTNTADIATKIKKLVIHHIADVNLTKIEIEIQQSGTPLEDALMIKQPIDKHVIRIAHNTVIKEVRAINPAMPLNSLHDLIFKILPID